VNAVAGVLLVIGFASFGTLVWLARGFLDRPVDIGPIMVWAVFAVFGAFCLYLAWRFFEPRGTPAEATATAGGAGAPQSRRVTLSHACSTAGVALVMLGVLLPDDWHPVAFFFVGLGLLAGAHVLTPCEERIEKLRKARASLPQL